MDWLLWVLHAIFWAPYIIRGQIDRREQKHIRGEPVHAAPGAMRLVHAHIAVTLVDHVGIKIGVVDGMKATLFPGQEIVATVLILAATGLSIWALLVFRSWRLRAELNARHELCTAGPFHYLRHPIYTALDLLTLATFLWLPNALTLFGFVGNVILGEWRARTEERLLLQAFGEEYRRYMAATARRIPGVY